MKEWVERCELPPNGLRLAQKSSPYAIGPSLKGSCLKLSPILTDFIELESAGKSQCEWTNQDL